MSRQILVTAVVSVGILGHGNPVTVADDSPNLAAQALAVFSAKCAACHGPELAKPKGRFGYVLDLARIASNRELVIPGAPDESELWGLISHDEMPPADSPAGPLSPAQKEVIRAWIAAGAPKNASASPQSAPEQNEDPPAIRVADSVYGWAINRLGPLHIVVVHFPIALLIAAAIGEILSLIRGVQTPSPAVRFCVLLGASSAVTAAALGWIHAANGYGLTMPHLLDLHRWSGITAAVWAIGTALLCEWDRRRGVRSARFRAWCIVGAALVGFSGHWGGLLVHGESFLSGG
jgi:mono/diheme cytochrome c family protein/uncharacterized membrane protein